MLPFYTPPGVFKVETWNGNIWEKLVKCNSQQFLTITSIYFEFNYTEILVLTSKWHFSRLVFSRWLLSWFPYHLSERMSSFEWGSSFVYIEIKIYEIINSVCCQPLGIVICVLQRSLHLTWRTKPPKINKIHWCWGTSNIVFRQLFYVLSIFIPCFQFHKESQNSREAGKLNRYAFTLFNRFLSLTYDC